MSVDRTQIDLGTIAAGANTGLLQMPTLQRGFDATLDMTIISDAPSPAVFRVKFVMDNSVATAVEYVYKIADAASPNNKITTPLRISTAITGNWKYEVLNDNAVDANTLAIFTLNAT